MKHQGKKIEDLTAETGSWSKAEMTFRKEKSAAIVFVAVILQGRILMIENLLLLARRQTGQEKEMCDAGTDTKDLNESMSNITIKSKAFVESYFMNDDTKV